MKRFIKLLLFTGIIFLSASQAHAFIQDITFDDPYSAIKEEISQYTTILSFETKKLSAIYPSEFINKAGMNYPGYRGPGQLVLYYPDFDYMTGTNEYGMEAIVEDGVVVRLSGANSVIPRNGFVVSGHGSSKNWIKEHLSIGTNIIIDGNTIIAYTTPESFVYKAKEAIKDADEFIDNARKSATVNADDKRANFYLKKAKSELKKAEKARGTMKIEYAKSSYQMSNLAIKFALPFIQDEFKGVWLRPSEKNVTDIRETLDNIKATGINDIFLETFFHGYTIYPSPVMQSYGLTVQNPKFTGFDPLKTYITEAHKRNLKIHCWFESFYIGNSNPEYDKTSILAVYPDWGNKNLANYEMQIVRHKVEHNGLFLDPANPEVKGFLLQLLNEISTMYAPDGINLDYTRYPNAQRANVSNYEQSNWGYTEIARAKFMEQYEVDPVEIKSNDPLWEKWSEYRQEQIHQYVKEARSVIPSDIYFTAVIFPDYKVCLETKQQDWAKWTRENLVDAVIPLIMTSDNTLFHQILRDVKSRVYGKTQILTGLFVGFMDGVPEDLLKQISTSRGLNSKGVVLFDWAHLPAKYQNVLKTRVFLPKTNKKAGK